MQLDEYKKPYLCLFNAVTDALEKLEQGQILAAQKLLIEGQQKAEEIFISAEEV